MWWPHAVALSLSFLTDYSLVFVFYLSLSLLESFGSAAQSGCTGSPAPPGWHIHMCGCKEICCVSQDCLKSREEIPGDQLLHEERQCCQTVRNRLHEDGTCAFAFAREHQNWQYHHWPRSLHRREQFHTEHM